MNNNTREDVEWLIFWLISIIVGSIIYIFYPNLLEVTPREKPNYQRVVVLQDGRKIKTTYFQISRWTFGQGVSIGDNHYAGNYSILIDYEPRK